MIDIHRHFADLSPRGDGQFMAKCPAHKDDKASLAISITPDKILFHCHAGCETDDMVHKLGITMSELFLDKRPSHVHSKPSRTPIAVYFYCDEHGHELFKKERYPGKQFGLFRKDGSQWIPKITNVRRVLYRLDELVSSDPNEEMIFVVEGEKDVDSLYHLGLLATTNYDGANVKKSKWLPEYVPYFANRDVVVLPDNDEVGRIHAQHVASSLVPVALSVRIVELPGLAEHEDVSDWLQRGGSPCKLIELVAKQEALEKPSANTPPPASQSQPEIKTGPDEHRVADEAIAALAQLPNVYQRGGMLVEVRESPEPPPNIQRPDGGIRAVPLSKTRVRDLLSQAARFTKFHKTEQSWHTCNVPDTCVSSVADRGIYPGLATLEGIVTAPQFLRDGSVLTSPGYDRGSGLYLSSEASFPEIPRQPDQVAAQVALKELLEVLQDFPLDDASLAAAVALMLTGAARHAIDGPTPLFAIDANVRGSGKSKLADAVSMIHTGRSLPRTSAASDDSEMRKRITSTLLSCEPFVMFDNVDSVLGCASLSCSA